MMNSDSIRKPDIRAVVWDLDGTLLDTETISTRAMDMELAKFGVQSNWSIKKDIIGLRGDVWSRIVIERLDLVGKLDPVEFVAAWEKNCALLYHEVEALPGAEYVTAQLHARGIPQAIATSSSMNAVAKKRLRHESIFARMAHIVTGEMVAKGKPAPDIFLLAAEMIRSTASAASTSASSDLLAPENVLVFEDSPLGIQAARAAGMYAIAVPDPRMDKEPFVAAGAHEIITSLEAFDFDKWITPTRID